MKIKKVFLETKRNRKVEVFKHNGEYVVVCSSQDKNNLTLYEEV